MRILQNIGRAIIKLAFFALFAYLLARPYMVAVVSLITERLPGPVEFASGIIGFVSRLVLLFVGMVLSYMLTRKVGELRLVQIVVGYASMAGMYWLAATIARFIGQVIGVLVKGILAVGAVIVIGCALVFVVLRIVGFGSVFLLGLLRDDDDD